MSSNPIKAIFYDLDGTLRISHPHGRTAFADEAARLGLPVSAEDRLRAGRWEHQYFAESQQIRADQAAFPDAKAFWVNYGRRQLVALGASPQQAEDLAPQLNQYMSEQYRPQDTLLPDVEHVLGKLKIAGYILAVVSNRDTPYQDYLNEIGIGEYFHFSLAAGEVNVWKPDKAVFEHALRLANVKAEEAVYVGDNYFADVLGARNAGMKPVLIDMDGLFEQPDCLVISAHKQLLDLLEREDVWMEDRSEFRLV